jgi:hypothetical protein
MPLNQSSALSAIRELQKTIDEPPGAVVNGKPVEGTWRTPHHDSDGPYISRYPSGFPGALQAVHAAGEKVRTALCPSGDGDLDSAGLPASARPLLRTVLKRLSRPQWQYHALDGKEEWDNWVALLDSAAAALAAENRTAPTTIVFLGDRQYRLGDGEVRKLDGTEDAVLKSYLDGPAWKAAGALSLRELRQRSRVDNPHRILERIMKKYKWEHAIRLPGGRGRGGYGVRIVRQ